MTIYNETNEIQQIDTNETQQIDTAPQITEEEQLKIYFAPIKS